MHLCLKKKNPFIESSTLMQMLQAQSSTETALPPRNIINTAALWGNEVHNSLYGSLSRGPAECSLLESNFISLPLLQGTKSSIFP